MPKKSSLSSKTTKKSPKKVKYDPKPILCHPSTWIAAVLALALLVVYGVSMYGFKNVIPKTELDVAKLNIFDNLIEENIRNQTINSDKPSVNEMTGYGISDEDGNFYVTFDYTTYENDENHVPKFDELKHGIMYFVKDTERNTYAHAFSYHDDYYHPGGTYVELKDHLLRTQFNPDGTWQNPQKTGND